MPTNAKLREGVIVEATNIGPDQRHAEYLEIQDACDRVFEHFEGGIIISKPMASESPMASVCASRN